MAINWGEIYNTTYWGEPTQSDWGNSYWTYANPSPTPFDEVLAENGDYLLTQQDENIIIE